MARFFKNKRAALGNIPGEPVFIGKKKMETTDIHIIEYNEIELQEYDPKPTGTIHTTPGHITWVNVNGLHDIDVITHVGKLLNIHPLALEDIVNTGQRPKIEDYDNHLYLVTKMIRYDETLKEVHSEQLSLVLGKDILITFQERPGDVFEPVRDRIRKQKGRIRSMGADYLAYSLLDCVADHYNFVVERMGDQIEDMEDEIRENPQKSLLEKINDYKLEINYLRKIIRPTRECFASLARMDTDLIADSTLPFLKDLLDTVLQVSEITDTYRDMLSDHLDIYNTGINNRLNEIMKVLTIFSAIFIPLTFIAGIYGTNFDFLPELHFKYSYPIFWGVLLIIAGIMLRFFRRKKWL